MTTNERQQIARQRVVMLLQEAHCNGEKYTDICRRAQERGHKLSPSTLSDIVSAKQVYIGVYTAYALADLYNMSIGYLLGEDEPDPKRGIIAKLFGGR